VAVFSWREHVALLLHDRGNQKEYAPHVTQRTGGGGSDGCDGDVGTIFCGLDQCACVVR
jgi:hypothetical protein